MNIGLLDIDCHASKKKWGATVYPNLALCKIAAWHKEQGDSVACIKEKRHFIGFELNKDYYDKACQRIDAERRQLTLF